MATKAQNTEWIEAFFTRAYPNLGFGSINQGDYVYEEQSNYYDVKSCPSDNYAQWGVGVATQTYPSLAELNGAPGNDKIVVRRKGRVKFYADNGLYFNPSNPVFIGTDAQHVTNDSTSNYYWIGFVANVEDGSQVNLLGTGDNTILVDLDPRWPERAMLEDTLGGNT